MHPLMFFFSKENFFKNKNQSISRTGFQNCNLWSWWQFQGKRTVRVLSGGTVYLCSKQSCFPSQLGPLRASTRGGLKPVRWWLPSLLGNLFQRLATIPVANSPHAELRFPSWQPVTAAWFWEQPESVCPWSAHWALRAGPPSLHSTSPAPHGLRPTLGVPLISLT